MSRYKRGGKISPRMIFPTVFAGPAAGGWTTTTTQIVSHARTPITGRTTSRRITQRSPLQCSRVFRENRLFRFCRHPRISHNSYILLSLILLLTYYNRLIRTVCHYVRPPCSRMPIYHVCRFSSGVNDHSSGPHGGWNSRSIGRHCSSRCGQPTDRREHREPGYATGSSTVQ